MPTPPVDTTTQQTDRRYATVMFADISGFTALSEKLDPEEVTTVMNGCFERLESIVFAHGGIVDEYLGDCIKAAFGFSPATLQPTVHAVRAALEIREAIEQFNRDYDLPAPLAVHIGLNTGTVIGVMMGSAERADFSVMGDTVRLAARLEDISDKGQIYVGPGTYDDTADEFEYRPLAPLQVDSARAAVQIYELTGLKRTRRVKRQSERRHATVVFADLIGVQALSLLLDDEALSRVMRDCFARLGEAVEAYGGVVDKFLGEGLMALFGVPNAIEHAPQQAINAAIEMRRLVAVLNTEQQLPMALDVHIGVNTGLVIAGDIGGRVKRDFTVMGDTVNVAARLKEAAARGAIYVGPETYRSTREEFEYQALEPLRLKGKGQPLPAFEVASQTTQVHRATATRTERMVFSAMVGRDAELARFSSALDRVVSGKGGIVSLVGEAGLGKSRLLAESLSLAEKTPVRVLLGRSLSIGRGQSFHPFVDLLRHWAGISEDAGEEPSLAALATAVRTVLGNETDEVFPFVARLMGLHPTGAPAERLAGIEGEALEKLILKSTRELFHAMAQRRPTVLVFEDLHWADQSSLNLLEALLPLCAETALLFVLVCRPLFEETSDRILQLCSARFESCYSEIRLEKLDQAASAKLIQNLLNIEDLPDSVRKLIAARAEGNPFYIEEVVRSLIDAGAVEYHEGRFRVTEKIHGVVIPGTIHDVIMARVDRLDESARQLLQMAAVVGRQFYHRIISHIIERDHPLDADLAVLKEKQLIQESGARWEVAVGDRGIAEELEYIFKHALAQEAVYESVLLKTRKELHGRVAQAIEELFAERLPEFYATLAYHYSRAEQLEPAEHYQCRAGEEALRSAAFSEALQLFSDAAAAYDILHGSAGGDAEHRAFLEKHLGLALLNTGQHGESIPHFDRALEWMGERVPKNLVAHALRWAVDMGVVLFRIYVHEGRRGQVPNIEHEREVFKLSLERGHAQVYSDPRRLFFETAGPLRRYHRLERTLIEHACGMYVGCAAIFAYSGLSFAVSKRMLEVAKTLMDENDIQDVFRYRSMLYTYEYFLGNWENAPTIEDAVIEQALRQGMLWDVTIHTAIEMDRYLRRGDFDRARTLLARLASIRDTYDYADAVSNHDGMQAILLLEERQLRDALALSERHHHLSREGTLKVMTLGMMAKARMLLGDRDGAADALSQAAAVTKREGVLSPWHQSIHHLAQLLFDVTALEAAVARREGASHTLRRAGIRSARRAIRTAGKVARERVETYNLTGRLWWALGNRRRAMKWWTKSITEATRIGARPELARTYYDVGRLIGPSTLNGKDGPAYLHLAQELFTTLDLKWDLDQLHAIEATAIGPEPESAVA